MTTFLGFTLPLNNFIRKLSFKVETSYIVSTPRYSSTLVEV